MQLKINPNNEEIVFSEANKLRFMSKQGVMTSTTIELSSDITKLCFNSSGTQLAVGTHEGKVVVYDAKTFAVVCQFSEPDKKSSIKGLSFSQTESYLAVASGTNVLNVWNTSTRSLAMTVDHTMNFRACQYVEGGQKLITAMISPDSDHSGIVVWYAEIFRNGKLCKYNTRLSKENCVKSIITAFAVSGDEKYVAIGTSEGEVYCYMSHNLRRYSVHKPHNWIVTDLSFVVPIRKEKKSITEGKKKSEMQIKSKE